MSHRIWHSVWIVVSLFGSTTGCIITSSGGASDYGLCSSNADCDSNTICQGSTVAGGSGSLCTTTCATAADCPPSTDGAGVACPVMGSSGTPQVCYRVCDSGGTCPGGLTCDTSASTPVCVPGSVTPTCGASGQACCANTTCNTGLTCTSGTCQGSTPTCGASGQACCANSTCNSGLTCTAGTCQTSTPTCGAIGQACCSGGTCTGESHGVACGPGSICALLQYSGCSTLGASCLTATSCVQPETMNPGSMGFCSATCSMMGAACPATPPGLMTADCFLIAGAADGMCFVPCTGNTSCPDGTVCVNTQIDGGGGCALDAQLCMPMPG